jgi:Transposase DDE domain
MNHLSQLQTVLKSLLDHQAQRIQGIAMFINAVIKTRTVDTTQIALTMPGDTQRSSRQKRVKRLLQEIRVNPAKLLEPDQPVSISLDRTEWDFGSVTNNLLTSAAELGGIVIPVAVTDLGKCGSSNDAERKKALQDLIKCIPAAQIKVLTADREFASASFFETLVKQGIAFAIRLKCDALITHQGETKPAHAWFRAYQRKRLKGAVVYGANVNICGRRLGRKYPAQEEYLIVVTSFEPDQGFAFYKARWCIETLFSRLKKRGFDLEATRVTRSEQLEHLVLLLGLVLWWAQRIGAWLVTRGGRETRADGVALRSVFRVGLDALRAWWLTDDRDQVLWAEFVALFHWSRVIQVSLETG